MRDQFDRNIDYIRISVTDRCNLRCRYCMPPEGVVPVEHSKILTFGEIVRLTELFAEAGIRKVKITGGEPLVRRGVLDLIRQIKNVPGIEEVTLTTNGILIGQQPELAGQLFAQSREEAERRLARYLAFADFRLKRDNEE